MARLFNDATPDWLSINTAAVTAMPLTLACWFNSNDATLTQGLVWLGDKDSDTHMFYLAARGATAGDPISAFIYGVSNAEALTSTGYSANTWHHACGVYTSATSRAAYIDGGSKGTNTTSITPSGVDRTSIGRLNRLTPSQAFSGRIAEVGIPLSSMTTLT